MKKLIEVKRRNQPLLFFPLTIRTLEGNCRKLQNGASTTLYKDHETEEVTICCPFFKRKFQLEPFNLQKESAQEVEVYFNFSNYAVYLSLIISFLLLIGFVYTVFLWGNISPFIIGMSLLLFMIVYKLNSSLTVKQYHTAQPKAPVHVGATK